MGVTDMAMAAARLRRLPHHCKMCGAAWHTTKQHARKAVEARVRSPIWRRRIAESNREKKTGKPSWNKGIKGSVPGRSSDPVIEAERRRKISVAKKGVKQSAQHRKRNSLGHLGIKPKWKDPKRRIRRIGAAQKGKTLSPAHLRNLRIASRKRRNPATTNRDCIADKNMKVYRPFVKVRDGYRCQQCGRTLAEMKRTGTPYLVLHHINHNHEDFYLDNLITLCHPDNIRAEAKKYKDAWEKKFKRYTTSIVYEVA